MTVNSLNTEQRIQLTRLAHIKGIYLILDFFI